jgi:hypothetical protein
MILQLSAPDIPKTTTWRFHPQMIKCIRDNIRYVLFDNAKYRESKMLYVLNDIMPDISKTKPKVDLQKQINKFTKNYLALNINL